MALYVEPNRGEVQHRKPVSTKGQIKWVGLDAKTKRRRKEGRRMSLFCKESLFRDPGPDPQEAEGSRLINLVGGAAFRLDLQRGGNSKGREN